MKIFKNRLVVAGICLVVASLIGFVGVPIINKISSQTTMVVRVNQDVSMGTQFTEDMLELVEVGKINLPENVAGRISDVVGLYATVDMKQDDMVVGKKVAEKLVLPENKIRQMRAGERAYAIQLGSSAPLRLLPNDIVAFYVYDSAGNAKVVPELNYVSVVVTTTSEGVDIFTATQTSGDGKRLSAAYATFILSEKQMERLLELEKSGNFSITLEYRGDDEAKIQEYLTKQDRILAGADAWEDQAGEDLDKEEVA